MGWVEGLTVLLVVGGAMCLLVIAAAGTRRYERAPWAVCADCQEPTDPPLFPLQDARGISFGLVCAECAQGLVNEGHAVWAEDNSSLCLV